MAQFNFDKDLLKRSAIDFATFKAEQQIRQITPDFRGSTLANSNFEEENFDKTSLFGTPVFSNFEIKAGEYTDLEGNIIQFEGIRIDNIMFDVTQERNIVRTQISGRNGTIKQFISDGDLVINCNGELTGRTVQENNGFSLSWLVGAPEEEVRKLKAITSVPREIEVISEFLDFFNVTTVVISQPSFSQKEGSREGILFQMQMYSDTPIELK